MRDEAYQATRELWTLRRDARESITRLLIARESIDAAELRSAVDGPAAA